MTIRELLQTELWSKETSQKILARAGKVLVPMGIVVGVLVLVIGIGLVIETRWMTAGERNAARTALAEIDALQSFLQADNNDFEARDQRTKEKVESAKHAAWTIRDRVAANSLSIYLSMIEDDRRDAEMDAKVQRVLKLRNIPRLRPDPEFDKTSEALKMQARFMDSFLLHKVLDK